VPVRRILASTGVRLALVQAAILIGAFSVAGSLARVVTQRILHREAQAHMAAEAAVLADEYAAGGRARLEASIAVRSRRRDGVYYRLGSADGRLLAGDLPQAPSALGWSYIDGDAGPPSASLVMNQDLVVYASRLPDGDVVAVGEAMGAHEQLRAELLRELFWCSLVAATGGLGVSLLVYGGVVRRINGVVAAAKEASLGRLDVRAPVRASFMRDDIDDLAKTFNHMLGQIDALMQNIRQVSADIAHDLRTPLTRVRQKLDLLRRARTEDTGLLEHIDSINADIAETLRAFDAMLRLAEIESARTGLSQEIDLAQIASRVAEAYRPDAEEGGRALETWLQAATVIGDGELLTHAVANLLDNALRHTPQGTRILLATGHQERAPYLEVSDNGPGVPEAHRTSVLERFFRLERSRTTAGTGLGLAIVAAIAARHRAELELRDAAPGLQVRIAFPPMNATVPARPRRPFPTAPKPVPVSQGERQ
jgi:signal transduction histidine kinase